MRLVLKLSGSALQSSEEVEKYIKILCFNVRQGVLSVLHAESASWTIGFTQRRKEQIERHKESPLSAFVKSLRLCVKLLFEVSVDDFEEFFGMKRFGQCADGAEAFRFVKHLLTPVRGDEKNGNLRLQTAQV